MVSEEKFVMVQSKQVSQPTVPGVFHLPPLNGHELFEITVHEIQHLYSSHAFTAVEYTQFCLDRIQAVNPYLEAVIETNPDALDIANELDKQRQHGIVRGPLHGILVLVKDVGALDSLTLLCSLALPIYSPHCM